MKKEKTGKRKKKWDKKEKSTIFGDRRIRDFECNGRIRLEISNENGPHDRNIKKTNVLGVVRFLFLVNIEEVPQQKKQ